MNLEELVDTTRNRMDQRDGIDDHDFAFAMLEVLRENGYSCVQLQALGFLDPFDSRSLARPAIQPTRLIESMPMVLVAPGNEPIPLVEKVTKHAIPVSLWDSALISDYDLILNSRARETFFGADDDQDVPDWDIIHDDDMPCPHPRRGVVKIGDPAGAYAAIDCCDLSECIDKAMAWCEGQVPGLARFVPDSAKEKASDHAST